jgi:hypothetical protein
MLRHLTSAGTCRLPKIDCRQPAPEYRRKLSSPQTSRSGKTGIGVRMGNLCALTIGQAGRQKDQLAAFLIVPQF